MAALHHLTWLLVAMLVVNLIVFAELIYYLYLTAKEAGERRRPDEDEDPSVVL